MFAEVKTFWACRTRANLWVVKGGLQDVEKLCILLSLIPYWQYFCNGIVLFTMSSR